MAAFLKRGKGRVAGVRLRGERDAAALLCDTPVLAGIGQEGLDRSHLDRVVLGPEAALATKRRDAALRRYAGACECEPVPRAAQQVRGPFQAHAGIGVRSPVGNGTHGEFLSSRIAVTLNTRNVSADLPLSCIPGSSSTAM